MTYSAPGPVEPDWRLLLYRRSFVEFHARERAASLLDEGNARELCGPFDGMESPWLEGQGIVPQADDGVVVVKGTLSGVPAVVIGIEQAFQGGAIGEVSGAKISAALGLAAAACRAGTPTTAVLLLETGGVRLQEANLGLAAVAEICASALELRALGPVIGLIAGAIGCFGGLSIAAGLCTRLVMTREGRLGLNGPEVIESEAGMTELDSHDRPAIWAIYGGASRVAIGHADTLVLDDIDAIRAATVTAVAGGVPEQHRSQDLAGARRLLDAVDPGSRPYRAGGRLAADIRPVSRGQAWTEALAAGPVQRKSDSVLRATMSLQHGEGVLLAVVPDLDSPYRRAADGEVGVREALVLAEEVTGILHGDRHVPRGDKRAIVAVVDFPSQAYGKLEEALGLHHLLACTVDAYAAARVAGHPIVALVVGHALSGGFLAHGLQANQILALDDPGVEVHAMHKSAAARITRRTVEELDTLGGRLVPLSYRVADWAKLGLCDELLQVVDADRPTAADVHRVTDALGAAVYRARSGPLDLSHRRSSAGALRNRQASRRVYELMAEQWWDEA